MSIRSATAAVTGIAIALLLAPAPTAQARPSSLVSIEQVSASRVHLQVFSAASRRVIPVDVLVPAGRGRAPTLYLLNGAGGGEDTANWFDQGRAPEFFADKNVNVVIPMAGSFSYYTDWRRDDPTLGRHRWETFLTRELPPIIDHTLGTTGRNAVAGLSMSGSAALVLAERAPRLYVAAASFSGCPNTSGMLGSAYVRMTVEGRGGGDVSNMWGPLGGPEWTAHDAEVNAARLRGKGVFVSAGAGLPGRYDDLADPAKAHQILIGGPIEAAVRQCSEQFVSRLHQLGIGVTTYFPGTGTHAFVYWHDALARAWPMLSRYLTG